MLSISSSNFTIFPSFLLHSFQFFISFRSSGLHFFLPIPFLAEFFFLSFPSFKKKLPALKEILEIGIWQDSLMATVVEVACYAILRGFFNL